MRARWQIITLALSACALGPACASPPDGPTDERAGARPGAGPQAAAEQVQVASASASASAAAPAAAPPTAAASPPALPAGDRIYARSRFVWIQKAPGARGWIGYLTLGGSVRLFEGDRERARTLGPGCEAWYRVEPTGYVCHDAATTLDPLDPEYVAMRDHAGRADGPFPFEYGESIGTPRYFAPPSDVQQRELEWDLDAHRRQLDLLAAALRSGRPDEADPLYREIDAGAANLDFPQLPKLGATVRENRHRVARGSTVAWSRAYDQGGRAWLYTSDHALVPKDRVKPYPKSSFQGVVLGEKVALPLAFFRVKDRPKYERSGERFTDNGETFARLSWVALTGEAVRSGGKTYLETTQGAWVLEADASVVKQAQTIPFVGDEAGSGRRTWLDVSVLGGTLVAYEGKQAVFATLIAGGRGGIPFPGRDAVSTASTPTGTFRVDGKFRWATMVSSSDSSVVHAEVQYVQNFHGPHALHGAYWHDAWGELKSGGCVNLSPIDSRWLFEWTEPRLPDGWHGMRSVAPFAAPTRVVVRP